MRHHNPETKAAVMACLLAGQGASQVANEYDLPRSTVLRWRKEARVEAAGSDDIGELLLDYLKSGLATVTVQHAVFQDAEWLRSQDASSLGVLHGILVDKCIRLLEALSGSPVQGNGR